MSQHIGHYVTHALAHHTQNPVSIIQRKIPPATASYLVQHWPQPLHLLRFGYIGFKDPNHAAVSFQLVQCR